MPRGRPPTNHFSIAQLEALLEKHRARVSELTREREKLQDKLDSLDSEIAALGGSGGSRSSSISSGAVRGKRAKNQKSLSETLIDVLTGQGTPMKVANIVDAVVLSGYKSSSPQFRSIVNQALIKDKRFHSTGRGFYQVRKSAEK